MFEYRKFHKSFTARTLVFAAGVAFAFWPATSSANEVLPHAPIQLAQTPPGGNPAPRGRVRIQGKDQKKEETPLPILKVSDYREAMRMYIQSISTYARRRKNNFIVMTKDGLDLLIKRDAVDAKIVSSARTYMRSIDGVVIDGLFYGRQAFGLPTEKKVLATRLPLVNRAINNGLKAFAIDYVKSPQEASESIKLNIARGLIPFPADTQRRILNSIPKYPARPIRENPNSILSLKDVKNFLYLRESSKFGRQDEFSLHLHGTNYDLVVVDVFHGRAPLSRQAVETLKFKKVGGRRLVFAHVDIATAASYRHYWKSRWREGSPVWIKAPVPGEPDRYFVEFWQPEWRRIISGNPKSYIFGIIAQGFDGVILEGVNAYRFFEGTANEPGAKSPGPL